MACNSQVHILHGMYQSDAWDTWPVLVRFMRCKTCTSEILKIHKLYQPCKWHTQTLAARYCKYHTPCTNRVHRMFLSCCQNDVYTWTTCKLQQSQLDCLWLTPNLNTFLNLGCIVTKVNIYKNNNHSGRQQHSFSTSHMMDINKVTPKLLPFLGMGILQEKLDLMFHYIWFYKK